MSKWIGVPKDISKYVGFVYKISHPDTGMYYIGKKKFYLKMKRKPLKGRTRCRRYLKESDWQNYWGSSDMFLHMVEKYGKHNFKREILYLCQTQFDLTYKELLEQLKHDVFNDPYSFNMIINVRLNRSKHALITNKMQEVEDGNRS
jgi:hypothetical protein